MYFAADIFKVEEIKYTKIDTKKEVIKKQTLCFCNRTWIHLV